MKKIVTFIILSLILSSVAVNADEYRAGTPKGFYEDIDPNSLDNDENNSQKDTIVQKDNNKSTPTNASEKSDTSQTPIISGTKDYMQIYNSLQIPDFSYLHDIDPDQYYDMKDAAWSVYPLLRLNSAIYFKNIVIEPGYYLLTPRENNGKWYILFKQNGLVKHIIPVYERDITPEFFYDEHIPKAKLTSAQKMHKGFLDLIGHAKSTKRKTPVKSYMEINDLDNYLISIIVYYGNHKYSTLFRTIRL